MNLVTNNKWIGQRTIRPDGMDKVTGRAQFAADTTMPGMIWGKVKRSPHPHARIKSIDTSKALIGSKLDDAALAKAAAACSAACRPIDDKRGTIAYRTKTAGVLLKRTALIAAKRAQGK